MRFVISGGTGFVGAALLEELRREYPDATLACLTRDAEKARLSAGAEPIQWNTHLPPTSVPGTELAKAVDGASAVLHLAGEAAVGKRLTESRKREIERSRVQSTALIVSAIASARTPPPVFISASAIGYYGPRASDELVDESASPGDDFLGRVCVEWERAAQKAESQTVRVVRTRLGIVLDAGGGALEAMARPIKLFVGGKIGTGRQVVSWVHRRDVARALVHCTKTAELTGAVNITAPHPVTNAELTREIGRVLRRPTPFVVPRPALRLAFGDGADALTTGQRVSSEKLQRSGFSFEFERVGEALEDALVS